MGFYLRLLLVILPLGSVACTQQQTDVGSIGSAQGLKYTVLSQNVALADGFTDLVVEVLVEDYLGNVIAHKVPPVSFPNDSGINHSACTESNLMGRSTCTFRSTLEGTKPIGIGQMTKTEISFTPVQIKAAGLFSVLPSMQFNGQAGDAVIHSSVGNHIDRPKQRPGGNWILFTDPAIRQ